MKKIFFMLVIVVLFVSCATELGTVGSLPRKWWKQPRGVVERVLRADSTGYYSKVIVIIGMDDSVMNYSESSALDSAKLDADAQLSQYIINKTTSVMREAVKTTLERETEVKSDEELERLVDEVYDKIQSSISVSQFSSFMIEGTHTEKDELNGIEYYKGYVCCTIQDEIVQSLQKIQKEAFESIISTAQAYAPIMEKIEAEAVKTMTDSLKKDLEGVEESIEKKSLK